MEPAACIAIGARRQLPLALARRQYVAGKTGQQQAALAASRLIGKVAQARVPGATVQQSQCELRPVDHQLCPQAGGRWADRFAAEQGQ
ncbi:hypothetical protein D3C75_1119410 [compost metagenome]